MSYWNGSGDYDEYDYEILDSGDYYCRLCNARMNNDMMLEAHFSGKKHLKQLKKPGNEAFAQRNALSSSYLNSHPYNRSGSSYSPSERNPSPRQLISTIRRDVSPKRVALPKPSQNTTFKSLLGDVQAKAAVSSPRSIYAIPVLAAASGAKPKSNSKSMVPIVDICSPHKVNSQLSKCDLNRMAAIPPLTEPPPFTIESPFVDCRLIGPPEPAFENRLVSTIIEVTPPIHPSSLSSCDELLKTVPTTLTLTYTSTPSQASDYKNSKSDQKDTFPFVPQKTGPKCSDSTDVDKPPLKSCLKNSKPVIEYASGVAGVGTPLLNDTIGSISSSGFISTFTEVTPQREPSPMSICITDEEVEVEEAVNSNTKDCAKPPASDAKQCHGIYSSNISVLAAHLEANFKGRKGKSPKSISNKMKQPSNRAIILYSDHSSVSGEEDNSPIDMRQIKGFPKCLTSEAKIAFVKILLNRFPKAKFIACFGMSPDIMEALTVVNLRKMSEKKLVKSYNKIETRPLREVIQLKKLQNLVLRMDLQD